MVMPIEEEKKEEVPVVKNKGGRPKKAPKTDDGQLMSILQGIATGMAGLEKRLNKIETGNRDAFKEAVRPEDVSLASETRRGIDPRISKIVDEILGEDFGVKIGQNPDKPGFLFTLIVPTRLSDNVVDKRPRIDPLAPAQYLKDKEGNVIFEEYTPEDHRSRAIASSENFDAIKQHCERVRSYIVAYHQKVSKPLPEFKVK